MTEHEPFLLTIAANPDDDAPRLVYADWLEEQGDPRGEFIRVQCELAKGIPDVLCSGDSFAEAVAAGKVHYSYDFSLHAELEERKLIPLRKRQSELKERERELLAMHEAAWHADLPEVLKRFRGKRCDNKCRHHKTAWTDAFVVDFSDSLRKGWEICKKCHGTGRVGGWVRGFCGEVSLTAAELCGYQCLQDGTGDQTHRLVSGHAAALGREPLLERVVLTDKSPIHWSNEGWAWYRYNSDSRVIEESHQLNKGLFKCLIPVENYAYGCQRCRLDTESAAIAARDRACLAYCRQEAAGRSRPIAEQETLADV